MQRREGIVIGAVAAILRLEAFLVLAGFVALYAAVHGNWILFIALLLAPDVAMLGYLRNTRVGAWAYNAFHSYTAPFVLAVVSVRVVELRPFAIVWGAHIAMDRALGYGLKYEDSFQHTHLGLIGRNTD